MLYTPNCDEKSYCGPTAMAAVTGEPVSLIKATIRQASGKILDASGRSHRVTGVSNRDLVKAMALLGWKVECSRYAFPTKPYRLRQFLLECGNDGPFIVNVTGHYLAVGWGEVVDTYNKIGVEIERYLKPSKARKPGAYVVAWWKFEKKETTE